MSRLVPDDAAATIAGSRPSSGAAHFVSSRPGYSVVGTLITYGSIPWILVTIPTLPLALGEARLPVFCLPVILWLAGKFAWPVRWWRWWYRAPGTVGLDERGVTWQATTGLPFIQRPVVTVPWENLGGVEVRGFVPVVVAPSGERVHAVGFDVQHLRAPGADDEVTFAQAIVAFKPDAYALDRPGRAQASGAHRRHPDEPASEVVPYPLAPVTAQRRTQAIFYLLLFVLAIARALAGS